MTRLQKMTISQAKAYCHKQGIEWENRTKLVQKCPCCGAYIQAETTKRQYGNYFYDPCKDCSWELNLGNLPQRFDWDDESVQLTLLSDDRRIVERDKRS